VGSPFSYTITAAHNPTSYNATGLPAGLSVNTATGVISGTPSAAGTSSVALSATNAAGTGSATLSLTINTAVTPSITSPLTASGTVGSPFSYTITGTSNPYSFNATGLPAGLSVNTATGVISGTPSAAGTSSVTLSATNAAGTGSATLSLTIVASGTPAVTSALTASGTASTPFSYTITATNSPTSFNAAGLPTGLSVNTATGAISGTPTAAGSYSLALSATNAAGTGLSATLALKIIAPGSSLFLASDVPAVANVSDSNAIELGVKFTASTTGNITALRFYKGAKNTGTHTVELWSATGTRLTSVTSGYETASGWQQINLTTPVSITAGTTYVASYHTSGFYSADGNYFATAHVNDPLTAPDSASSGGNGVYIYGSTVSFPSNTYNATNFWVDVVFSATPAPPAITSALTASGTVGTPFSYAITAANFPTSFSAAGLPAGLSINTATGVISGTPTVGGTSSVALSATNTAGTGSATLALSVIASGSSLFLASDVPAVVNVNDPSSVELGVKFTASTAGNITALRFYKGAQNTGTHTVELWSATGTMLTSVTSGYETASGWQQVNLPTPVSITVGTTYVASYHTKGFYSADGNYFATAHFNGPMTAPDGASSGGNGVYAYGNAVSFPSNTFNAANYWVDVVFAATAAPPAITSALTASGTTGTSFNYTLTATNSPTSFNATGLPAGLSINTATGVISGTPTAAGTSSVPLSATNAAGTGSATLALTIVAPGSSLFLASDVPAVVNVNDPNAIELGVKFTASTTGNATALRFYKGAQNTGTHTVHLWSATGTLLASATFANETASGWQQVNLPTPVSITAGTTYVASYHTNGFYSADGNYFATAHSRGPLTAPDSASSGGNGVYIYGSTVIFPSNSYNATNYWVDVVLQ